MSALRTFKAESSDIKHLISFENHKNDHHLHAYLEFEEPLDLTILEQATRLLGKRLPHLFSYFKQNQDSAAWHENHFATQDFISFIQTKDPEREVQQALVKKLQIETGPQIRLTVIRSENKEELVIILNHMLVDGAGFKELLYLLADCYSKLQRNPDFTIKEELPRRGLNQIFENFSLKEKWQILNDKTATPPTKNPSSPLKGDTHHPYILRTKISKAQFLYIKAYAKSHGVTVNDCLLTALSLAINEKFATTEFDIDCPIDIRKYNKQSNGLTNLTANLTFSFNEDDFNHFETTLLRKKTLFKEQKNSLQPLHKFYVLDLIYKFLSYKTYKKQVKIRYDIPQTSLTNMGIIDWTLLHFSQNVVRDVYISGSLKYAPYCQIAATTFKDELTLSTNLHGTKEDYYFQLALLETMKGHLPH